jgi:protein phosphatase
MQLHYDAKTDIGRQRQVNQDSFRVYDPATTDTGGQPDKLFVVCDGMGGHAAGEVASRLGVETIVETFANTSDADPRRVLVHAFQEANQRIYQEGQGGMGTTGVAALLRDQRLWVANVGDSRAYLVRQGQIRQISSDHSFVWEQVAAGVLTPEQARHSSYRNMITRALGHRPDVEVDIFEETLQAGDIILLSSDGLHGLVEDHELAGAVSSMAPEGAVPFLIDKANERGGTDNITVVIVRVESLGGESVTTQKGKQAATTRPMATVAPGDTTQQGATNATTERLEPQSAPVTRDLSQDAPPAATTARSGGRGWIIAIVVAIAVAVGAGGGSAVYFGVGGDISNDTGGGVGTGTITSTATLTPTGTLALTPTTSPDAESASPAPDITETVAPPPTNATVGPTPPATRTLRPSVQGGTGDGSVLDEGKTAVPKDDTPTPTPTAAG